MYRLDPRYAPAPQAAFHTGWQAVASQLPYGSAVVAVEGPPSVDWSLLADRLAHELTERGTPVTLLDIRTHYAPPALVRTRTERPADADDPYFRKLADNPLDDLFETLPVSAPPVEGLLLVYGPRRRPRGARRALVRRCARCATRRPPSARARQAPTSVCRTRSPTSGGCSTSTGRCSTGTATRSLAASTPGSTCSTPTTRRGSPERACAPPASDPGSAGPLRTRPYFNSTPWGGHWAQRELGFNPDSRNTALGYELIAPEAGHPHRHRTGGPGRGAVPTPLCVLEPLSVLGAEVHARFGTSFPIRFDYLDTIGGGSLSVHCHPKESYMRERFGWDYTQHETYYPSPSAAPTPRCTSACARMPTSTPSARRWSGRSPTESPWTPRTTPVLPRRAGPVVHDPGGHPARRRRGQPRPGDQRHAVSLQPAVLRLAAPRRRRPPAPAAVRARVRQPGDRSTRRGRRP
ncbi:hypothetical protein ACRAWF_12405 [Streptomyces sp. L7]